MFRDILGFAVFAVAVWLVLKIVFELLGTVVGLALTVVSLAAVGYALYLLLRIFCPSTAAKARDMIKGWPRTVV